MLIKCICKSCAGHLEFEEENAGQKIKCPHCGFDTTLYVPGAERVEAELVTLNRRLRSQKFLMLGAGVLLALGGVGWCVYHWGMPLVEELFPSIESGVARVLILAGFCLVVPLVLLWLVLPIFLFFAARRFLRLVGNIEQHLRMLGTTEPPDMAEPAEEVVEVEDEVEEPDA